MTESVALKTLYEDEYLFVVIKPPLMHSVNGADPTVITCESIVREQFKTSSLADGGLIHRLDYETSGILVGAKDSATYERMRQMIQGGDVHKEYLVLAQGVLRSETVVQGWIGARHRGSKKVTFWEHAPKQGRVLEAHTTIRPLFCISRPDGEAATVALVTAPVARRHQVRVSCAYRGAPLVGDTLYGASSSLDSWRRAIPDRYMSTFFLHAHQVSFTHPVRADLPQIVCSTGVLDEVAALAKTAGR